MGLRQAFTDALKASMLAGDAARTSTLRLILARLKDLDIAARPAVADGVPEADIMAMLRGMVKQRRESVELYRQGRRQDLVDKETAEIAVVEAFLPRAMDEQTLGAAVDAAIAGTGAAGLKDMGRVMAALKAAHGAELDLGRAGAVARARLASAAPA